VAAIAGSVFYYRVHQQNEEAKSDIYSTGSQGLLPDNKYERMDPEAGGDSDRESSGHVAYT